MDNNNQSFKINVEQCNDQAIGCNCTCNLITPEKIFNSVAYVVKKIAQIFSCYKGQNENSPSNLI